MSVRSFFTDIKGTPFGRASRGRAGSAPGAACGRPPPRARRITRRLWRGLLASGGHGVRQRCRVLPDDGPPDTAAAARHLGPHPATSAGRRHAAGDRGCPSGPPVPLAPGILSPSKDHSQGALPAVASHAMALRATLEQ